MDNIYELEVWTEVDTFGKARIVKRAKLNDLIQLEELEKRWGNGKENIPVKPSVSQDIKCKFCGSEMWNNETNKKTPKSPDRKCKDKACGGAYWIKTDYWSK